MSELAISSAQMSTERRWSTATGMALFLMAAAGGFTYGYAHPLLHVIDDPTATSAAVQSRPILLWLVAAVWAAVALLDLLVSYGIYVVYRGSARVLSILAAAVRVIYTIVLVVAVAELWSLLFNNYATSALDRFDSFEKIWSRGLVIFGVHLLMLSRLVIYAKRSGALVAMLLGVGGAGYVVVNGLKVFGSQLLVMQDLLIAVLSIPMVLGELLFALVLLTSGFNVHKDSSKQRQNDLGTRNIRSRIKENC